MGTSLLGKLILNDEVYLNHDPVKKYLREGSYWMLVDNRMLGEVYFDGKLEIPKETLDELSTYEGKVIELSFIDKNG